MEVSPAMFRVFLVFAVGLIAGSTAGAGVNVWTSSGPPGAVTALAIDPNGSWLLAGATVDGRSIGYRSDDHGARWTSVGEAPSGSEISAFTVTAGSVDAYVTTSYRPWGGRVFRSGDAGMTWAEAGSLGNATSITSLATRATEPGTLFGGATNCFCAGIPCIAHIQCAAAVLRSTDFATTWSFLGFRLGGRTLTAIVLDPLDSNRIYAAGDGGVFVSFDGGTRWIASNTGLEGCSSVRALDLLSDGTLLITTASNQPGSSSCGGLFRSADSARTWTPIGPPTQLATSLAVDPTNPRVIYVGTSNGAGVFRSEDGGETWAAFGSIPGSPDVRQIVVEPSGRFVHAGTSAGVFDYEIVPGARPPVVPPRDRETRTVLPRP